MYTFIVNPNARTGLGLKTWKTLELILKERGISYQVFFTKYQKHATRITEKLTEENEHRMIIALGGVQNHCLNQWVCNRVWFWKGRKFR